MKTILYYYNLIGLEYVKADIRSILANVKYQKARNIENKRNWHIFAFVGEHGTCKKTTARSLTHELFKLGEITKDHMKIIRAADLEAKPSESIKKLDSFEGVLYIRDMHNLERKFSFSPASAVDLLLDFLEESNPSITVIIEFSRYSFDTAMQFNARFYETLKEDPINRSIGFKYYYTAEQAIDVLRAMASHIEQITEISFYQPVVFDFAFIELAMRVFEGIVKEKGPNVIDGVAIKDFFKACIDQFICKRTRFTEKTKVYLETEDDIPEKYKRYLKKPAKIAKEELCFLPFHPALTKDEKISELERSVVLVQGYRRNNTIPIQSTGVIITNSGYVLVCKHCVENYDLFKVRVYTPGAGGDYRWFEAELCKTENEPEYDQALLKMNGYNFPCISLMDESETTSSNEELTVIGFPFADGLADHIEKLSPSVMPAWLASVQKKHGIQTYYLAGINGYGGMSGAPVVSETGKLVCIVQGEEYDSTNKHQNGIMFATAPNLKAITKQEEPSYTVADINDDELPFYI